MTGKILLPVSSVDSQNDAQELSFNGCGKFSLSEFKKIASLSKEEPSAPEGEDKALFHSGVRNVLILEIVALALLFSALLTLG